MGKQFFGYGGGGGRERELFSIIELFFRPWTFLVHVIASK